MLVIGRSVLASSIILVVRVVHLQIENWRGVGGSVGQVLLVITEISVEVV